jgi:hypothetical protein
MNKITELKLYRRYAFAQESERMQSMSDNVCNKRIKKYPAERAVFDSTLYFQQFQLHLIIVCLVETKSKQF